MLSTTESAREIAQAERSGNATGEILAPIGTNFVANLRMLLRARRLILRIFVMGVILSIGCVLLIPNRYRSTVRLMPPDAQNSSGLAALAKFAGGQGGALGALGDELRPNGNAAMFVAVLHSRTMQDEIVRQFDLRAVYRVKRWEAARRILNDNTEVVEDRRSGVIAVSVIDHKPDRAAAMAQAYIRELDRLVATLNTSAAHRERVFLEERLKDVSRELQRTSTALAEFSSKSGMLDLKEQAKATVSAAANLEGELIAAESELKGLEEIYTANNSRVRSLRARVEELRKNVAAVGGKQTDTERELPGMRQLPVLGVRFAELYRNAMVQEKVFEHLTTEYELAKVQEAKEIPSVRVLDAADLPEVKAGPNRVLIVAAGALLSLVFAVLVVVERARWERLPSDHPLKEFGSEVWAAGLALLRTWSFRIKRAPSRRLRVHPSDGDPDGHQ